MYNKRYIASILVEADSPLKVGSGKKDVLKDAPILRDFNNLPMILGTSIAGVLRKHYKEFYKNDDELFGFQKGKNAHGSRVVVSNAHMVDENGTVIEELALEKSEFLERFETLSIREHVKINHQGVAENHGKFDEEVVFRGSRFKFELELIGDENDKDVWKKLLNILNTPTFRLGSGSTKGFGKLKIISLNCEIFDIKDKAYIEKSSSLNSHFGDRYTLKDCKDNTTTYTLILQADDFFMFGGGFGDEEADMTPVMEECIVWQEDKKAKFTDKQILIPASSLKGALSHRVAYYYNKEKSIYADKIEVDEFVNHVGENNAAVKGIFGHKKELKDGTELGQKGKIILTDMFQIQQEENKKVFDHVKIDRFTGGAMDGALFQEKTIAQDEKWQIEIVVERLDKEYVNALEYALKDIASGMLPLGGSVNRGHGIFQGSLQKQEEVLYA